jgi:hypothetical protein
MQESEDSWLNAVRPKTPRSYKTVRRWALHVVNLIERSTHLPMNCHVSLGSIKNLKVLIDIIDNRKWKSPKMELYHLYCLQNVADFYFKELVKIGKRIK